MCVGLCVAVCGWFLRAYRRVCLRIFCVRVREYANVRACAPHARANARLCACACAFGRVCVRVRTYAWVRLWLRVCECACVRASVCLRGRAHTRECCFVYTRMYTYVSAYVCISVHASSTCTTRSAECSTSLYIVWKCVVACSASGVIACACWFAPTPAAVTGVAGEGGVHGTR